MFWRRNLCGIAVSLALSTVAIAQDDVAEVAINHDKQKPVVASENTIDKPIYTGIDGQLIRLTHPLETLASSKPHPLEPVNMNKLKGRTYRLDMETALLMRDQPSGLSSVLRGAAAGAGIGGGLSDGDLGGILLGAGIGGLLGLGDAKARADDPTLFVRQQERRRREAWDRNFYFNNGNGMGHINSPTGYIGSLAVVPDNINILDPESLVPGGRVPPVPAHLRPVDK